MPNYIQLTCKKTGNPATFQDIDNILCKALNVPCDEKQYYCQWYDIIGYSRKSNIQDIITTIKGFNQKLPGDDELIRVLAWIDENYKLDAWCSR